jgi:hypothetical protein
VVFYIFWKLYESRPLGLEIMQHFVIFHFGGDCLTMPTFWGFWGQITPKSILIQFLSEKDHNFHQTASFEPLPMRIGFTIWAVTWSKEKGKKLGTREICINSRLHPKIPFHPIQTKMVWDPCIVNLINHSKFSWNRLLHVQNMMSLNFAGPLRKPYRL